MSDPNQIPNVIIVQSPKSVGIGLLLTFLFGPFGMLYGTIWGGCIMLVINVVVAILTFGFGLLLTWPIQLIWVVISIISYNNKLMKPRA